MKQWILFFALSICLATQGAPNKDQETKKNAGSETEIATFAGGCFWCMQPPFDKLKGVIETTVGYSGGDENNPTYHDVAYGKTGHAEAVQVEYKPKEISYNKLVEVFWKNINPTQIDGQFADRGKQYRTEIFFHTPAQKKIATEAKKKLSDSKKFKDPIATKISKFKSFYPAETYHQKYYKKNPADYQRYRIGSGRDTYLKETWK